MGVIENDLLVFSVLWHYSSHDRAPYIAQHQVSQRVSVAHFATFLVQSFKAHVSTVASEANTFFKECQLIGMNQIGPMFLGRSVLDQRRPSTSIVHVHAFRHAEPLTGRVIKCRKSPTSDIQHSIQFPGGCICSFQPFQLFETKQYLVTTIHIST